MKNRSFPRKIKFAPGVKSIFLSLFSLILAANSSGQSAQMKFQKMDFEEGLPDNSCLSIIQDGLGFLWVGTWDGLARYDGYDVITYKPDKNDPYSIKGRSMAALAEGRDGNLWVGTEWGLHYFDRNTERFKNILIDSNRVNPDPGYPWVVHYLFEDKRGQVWTISGEERSLHRYDPSASQLNAAVLKPNDQETIKVAKIHNWWPQAPILEDGRGKIWIGTYEGLVKYDPNTEEYTRFSEHDYTCLENDTIYSLLLEADSILWLGTAEGLCKFHLGEEQFSPAHFKSDDLAAGTIPAPVLDLRVDPYNGDIWILRKHTLEKVNKDSKAIETLVNLPPPNENFPHSSEYNHPSFHWLGEDRNGHLSFVSSLDRFHIYRYDCFQKALTTQQITFDGMFRLWGFQANGILGHGLVDNSGLVWLGYKHQGILKEIRKKGKFEHFSLHQGGGARERGKLFEDREGRIWIFEFTPSLFLPDSRKLIDLANWPENSEEVRDFDLVYDLVEHDGAIWYGTVTGLYKIPMGQHPQAYRNLAQGKKISASSYENTIQMPAFANDGNMFSRWASALWVDPSWIAIDLEERTTVHKIVIHWEASAAKKYAIQVSDDSLNWRTVFTESSGKGGKEELLVDFTARFVRLLGMERMSPYGYSLFEIELYGPSPKIIRYQHDPHDLTTIQSNQVARIFVDKEHNLWVCTVAGLSKYDPEHDHFDRYDEASMDGASPLFFLVDDRGALWGKVAAAIVTYNPQNNTFSTYSPIPGDSSSIGSIDLTSYLIDREGGLWLGASAGINRYNREQDNFTRFLTDKYINAIYRCSNGYYWIGTSNSGVFRLDPKTREVRNYHERSGLCHNFVGSINEDNRGRLWLGTKRGLSCFHPDTETFTNYTKADGLQRNDMSGHSLKDGLGYLYYVRSGKMTVFNPADIDVDPSVPQLVITDLRIAHRSIHPTDKKSPLTRNIAVTDKIQLKHHQNVLTFVFAALHYDNPGRNLYRVKMEGLDTAWVDLGTQRQMNYSGLSPGKYTFLVKGANSDGTWNDRPASLQLTILPPWWLSISAKVFYVLFGVLGLYALYRWRTTHQRRKLLEAHQLNERLQHVDKLKDQFLANTSHELRTPLQGIIGLSEAMQDRSEDARDLEDLSMIISSGKRLNSLVNDILDFSKLKNYDIELLRKPVNLRVLVDIVFRNNAPLIRNKNLQLINEIPDDLPAADADENRLQQVFYNLVGNAIKFTERGYVKVTASETGKLIQVAVEDTGTGIPKNKQETIFQEFEQGDGSTVREFAGTGLGLSISKRLVELHSGELWVESDVGKGSAFFFTLPVSTRKATTLSQMEEVRRPSLRSDTVSVRAAAQTGEGNIRILVVDDEPINQQVLKNHLDNRGFHLTQAMNGEEAIHIIQSSEPFDLILLDVMMPRMSGYEVCQKIREKFLPSELPIIMVTAKNQLQDVVEGLSLGANDYLPKPFQKEELLARINTQLDLHRIFDVAGRFVPNEFLHTLNRNRLTEVVLGDHAEREVTVLFSDIRDYTTLAETMTPEENFKFVNAFHRRMGPIIRQHDGFINQYLGDAIMAIFPNCPQDALETAIDMQKRLMEYNQERHSKGREPIRMGIGLHTGDLIMGIIGDQHRMDAATIADTVNTASRIESLTKHYGASILLSEESVNKMDAGDRFHLRYLGKVVVKGKKEPVGIYECYDGDGLEMVERKSNAQPDFTRGLQQYFDREFPEAAAVFSRILKLNGADHPARLFMNKSSEHILNGVPDDWTGVEVMTFK